MIIVKDFLYSHFGEPIKGKGDPNLVRFAHNWNNGMLEYWNIVAGQGDVASFPSLLTGYHQRLVFIKYDLPLFHSVKNTRLIDSKIPRNICRWMSSFFNSKVGNQCL